MPVYQPNAVVGNSQVLVTLGARGELMTFFYPHIDFSQNIHEGMPAVSTPFFWFEGSEKQDPAEVLTSAAERLQRWDPDSAKIPAAVDARKSTVAALGEPLICLRERDFWAIVREWTE